MLHEILSPYGRQNDKLKNDKNAVPPSKAVWKLSP